MAAKLECFLPEGVEIDIQPASQRREWMDHTDKAFAYRCIPLAIANSHGWEIRSPIAFEAEWNGGDRPDDVSVFAEADVSGFVAGHFGYGVLTFRQGAVFRTPSGINLWVSGPPNRPKDAIQPLSAIVETDWMPYTFTMNWKFTRPNHRVRFEAGEPYCFLFPIARNTIGEFQPVLRDLSEDRQLEQNYWRASHWRLFSTKVNKLKGVWLEQHRFQKWYQLGRRPDGSPGPDDHQKLIRLRPFDREMAERLETDPEK